MRKTWTDEKELIKHVKNKVFNVGTVTIRVVFRYEEGLWYVDFVRLIDMLDIDMGIMGEYIAHPKPNMVSKIMDVPEVLESTKHALMLKLVEEGSKIPWWGVDIPKEERRYYLDKFFRNPDIPVIHETVQIA